MMLDQAVCKIRNIHNLYELRGPILFFGLAMWVVTPIMGIFPILLSIQLDLLNPRRQKQKLLSLNNLLLVLVILSITIYISSFEIFADTRVYLNIYKTLDTKGVFDNFLVENRYEFVLPLLLYPINILTNGSEYWCLVIFALIINSVVVFYISKSTSSKYFPSLLIILFSTFFYYSQVFYMRQFLSIVLVFMAIVNLDKNRILFIIYSILAIFAHITSAMYIAVFLIIKASYLIAENLRFKLTKTELFFIYLIAGGLLIVLIYIALKIYSNPQQVYDYVNNLLDFLPEKTLANSLQDRVDNYDGRDQELFKLTIYRVIAIASVGVFIVMKEYKDLTSRLLSFNLIYLISLLQLAFIMLTGFNQRIAYLFLTFYGLFFCIGLDDKSKIKPFGAVSLITMFMAAANTFNFLRIQEAMIDSTGWSFFEGQPLAMSVYDYILYFFQSI